VKFRAGDLEFNANIAEMSEASSPQTGEPLRALTIQFRAQKEEIHAQALEAVQQRQTGGLFSLDEADEPDTEWRIAESSATYVGSAPWGVNHHVWRIEQVERLACARLIVGSIELEPYEYVEELDAPSGTVRLAARALVSDTALAELAAIDGPVDVVRVGISETPRQMTVQYVWGGAGQAGRAGQAVALVCAELGEPRVRLAGATLGDDRLGDLVRLLAGRGVLTAGDLEQLRAQRHARRRVVAVDDWRL
jgi:hypothetical protein